MGAVFIYNSVYVADPVFKLTGIYLYPDGFVILLYVGGNIVVGKQPFDEVEKRFKAMGFDRVFGPGTPPETTIAALYEDLGVQPPEETEE